MSGSASRIVVSRKNDNIRVGIILAFLAAAFFFGFMAKFYFLR
jgi:hypothetical protein